MMIWSLKLSELHLSELGRNQVKGIMKAAVDEINAIANREGGRSPDPNHQLCLLPRGQRVSLPPLSVSGLRKLGMEKH